MSLAANLRARTIGFVLCVLAIGGHLHQVAHMLVHQHVFCAEHGTVEHREAPAEDSCHSCAHHAVPPAGDATLPEDPEEGSDHEGCSTPVLLSIGDGQLAHADTLVTTERWTAMQVTESAPALLPLRRDLRSRAPPAVA